MSVDTEGDAATGAAPDRPRGADALTKALGAGRAAHLHLRQLSRRHRLQRAAVRDAGRLLEATRDLIASCECERGCPSCVGPIGEIGPQGKRVALDLLERLTGRPASSASAPPAIDEGEVPF